MLSADSMIGYSEHMKIDKILRTFRDSYKSNLSIIFIDDIERIIEYTPVGARFNNAILQTLLILIRKVPPKPPVIPGVVQADPRLLVIATSSIANLLEDIQLTAAFNVSLHVSQLQSQDEYAAVIRKYAEDVSPEDVETLASVIQQPIGIKQLMMVLEMARDENGKISVEGFQDCLSTYCP
jgi:vesicle-fusing ATPase